MIDPSTIGTGAEQLASRIDNLWIIVAAALVFTMQAGFLCFEIGAVRLKNVTATAMKNLADWVILSLLFGALGFGLMFGHSASGWVGTDLFFLTGMDAPGHSELGLTFFIYQLAFAGAAATIVSGAMAERTGFVAYASLAAVIGLVIYPVFGHWVWGNAYFGDNPALLADLGFVDFAGSSVVHLVGACIAFVGIRMVGPRLGRFDEDGKPQALRPHSLAWSAFGTLLLWFGWWGFNGGSTLAFDERVPGIILNTNLAAAAGGMAAFAHCFAFQAKEGIEGKLLGGVLGGLVAITACAHVVSPTAAIAVGLGAGVIHNISASFALEKLRIDDPVGAIPVHGFCGAWGIVCVALLGNASSLPLAFWPQLGVQLLGIGVCVAWTCGAAWLTLRAVKHFVGLRVAPDLEIFGLTISGDLPEDAARASAEEGGADPMATELDDEAAAMLAAMLAGDEAANDPGHDARAAGEE